MTLEGHARVQFRAPLRSLRAWGPCGPEVALDHKPEPTMTDSPVAVSRTPIEITTTSGQKLRMTRRVKAAIDAMVWQGLKRDDAAQSVGMKDNSLYVALAKPDVRAYYLSQCEVLRVSGKARRIFRLEEIAAQDENKQAAVNSIRALELMGDDVAVGAGLQHRAGMVIVVVNGATGGSVTSPDRPDQALVIDHEP